MGISVASGNRKREETRSQALSLLAMASSMIALAARNAASIDISRGIEQVRVGGGLQRRVGAAHVALVAAHDIGEDFGEIGRAAAASISRSRRCARTSALAVT